MHVTSRCQGLFPPHPLFKGKALGTRLVRNLNTSVSSTESSSTGSWASWWGRWYSFKRYRKASLIALASSFRERFSTPSICSWLVRFPEEHCAPHSRVSSFICSTLDFLSFTVYNFYVKLVLHCLCANMQIMLVFRFRINVRMAKSWTSEINLIYCLH